MSDRQGGLVQAALSRARTLSSGWTRRRKESVGGEVVERLLVEYMYVAVAMIRSF